MSLISIVGKGAAVAVALLLLHPGQSAAATAGADTSGSLAHFIVVAGDTLWVAEPLEVLRPEEPWEGSDLPLVASIRSFRPEPANQLRDPYVFVDIDGQAYLFYAVAVESGIAVARLGST